MIASSSIDPGMKGLNSVASKLTLNGTYDIAFLAGLVGVAFLGDRICDVLKMRKKKKKSYVLTISRTYTCIHL